MRKIVSLIGGFIIIVTIIANLNNSVFERKRHSLSIKELTLLALADQEGGTFCCLWCPEPIGLICTTCIPGDQCWSNPGGMAYCRDPYYGIGYNMIYCSL